MTSDNDTVRVLVLAQLLLTYEKESGWPLREQVEPGSAHLTVSGRFQSDKYLWCPAGFVPIKTTDPMAQDLLREYAKRRAAVDKDFCADLLAALPPEGEQAPATRAAGTSERGR